MSCLQDSSQKGAFVETSKLHILSTHILANINVSQTRSKHNHISQIIHPTNRPTNSSYHSHINVSQTWLKNNYISNLTCQSICKP